MCKQVNAVGFKIPFDKAMLAELKEAYHIAKSNDNTSFTFYGREVLVEYAKFLIEYLDMRFKSN